MTSEPALPRRRLSVDNRRDELLDAAKDLYARMAPEDVNINDIAAAAGASRALVYHYFGGKQELYLAAMRQTADELIERLTDPIDGTVQEQLTEALRRYFDFAEERAAGFVALLRGGPARSGDDAGAIAADVRGVLLEWLVANTDVVEPSHLFRVTLQGWMAAVEVAAVDWLEHRADDRAVIERLLVDQLVAMVIATAQYDPALAAFLPRLA